MAGKEVAQVGPKTVKVMVEERKGEIQHLLPTHVPGDRFIKSALIATQNNEKVRQSDPSSVMAAIYTAAELGLDFVAVKGHAYLVPFWNKDRNCFETQFMPGYRGLIDLVMRTGFYRKIESHVVYQKDKFEIYYGTDPKMIHIPYLAGEPGPVIGTYSIAFPNEGDPQSEFMSLSALEKIRKRSKNPTSGPWANDTEEMYRKTCVKRLFKYLKSSPDLDKALERDDEVSGLADTGFEPPVIVKPEPETREAEVVQEQVPAQEQQAAHEQKQEQTPPPLSQPSKAKKNQTASTQPAATQAAAPTSPEQEPDLF